ncbi:MAG: guanylate kinase [Bacteroidetes bacterium]|jgi:guanylate kinase|nr:guanylate kinase [Bacteroidota bacterium]MDF1866226.1 guanylate kinase [Saprospiraceae bacterium]
MGKLIIVTAASGAGKTTIVKNLLKKFDNLAFSISATTRAPRPGEVNGVDYYFIEKEDFEMKVKNEEFVEWEEIYPGQSSGTLKKEVERLWSEGKHILFDIDVKGAENIKKVYPENSLAIYIKPPSEATLFKRLRNRKTESDEKLKARFERAKMELAYENNFDMIVLNDTLKLAYFESEHIVNSFLKK